jgi:hypothetical protein
MLKSMQSSTRLRGERFQITVSPENPGSQVIGDLAVGPDHDTIWVKVTSGSSGDCPWPWSYGLFTWVTSEGRELGTVKVNGVCEGEVFRLGVGLPPLERNGQLRFTPRAYNTNWVKLGNPWPLTFEVISGKGEDQLPSFGSRATLMVPAVPRGNAVPDFYIEGEIARLLLNLVFKK